MVALLPGSEWTPEEAGCDDPVLVVEASIDPDSPVPEGLVELVPGHHLAIFADARTPPSRCWGRRLEPRTI
jgi:hypothetical protein